MPKIIDSRTVLAVRNLQTSTEYYTTVLGFTHEPIGDGFWSFLTRDSISLLLGKCPDEKPASEIGDHSYVLYLYVEGIDELYEQLIGRGAQITSAPEDTDWGLREFSLVTPDGHPEWPNSDLKRDRTMLFGETVAVETNYLRQRLNVFMRVTRILEKVLARREAGAGGAPRRRTGRS